jgi:hypothetical protein
MWMRALLLSGACAVCFAGPLRAENNGPAVTVEECWSRWLGDQQLADGFNNKDGRTIIVAQGTGTVAADKGSQKFVPARSAAFTQAELAAKKSISDYVGTEVRSNRAASIYIAGGDIPPPALEKPVKDLSIAEKMHTLAGLALDDAIRYFDPNWDSSGKTEEQKRQEAVRIQTAVTEHIAARSALLTEGAFVATQCEGPNSDGKYTVLTGLIWSNRLAAIAQSMADPAIKQPQMPPGTPIPEQFKNETEKNPDWLAYTQGARVWFNEAGETVILGFGVAPGSSVAGGDQARARLQALAAIQRFVGEQIEAEASDDTNFSTREYTSGEQKVFDASAFNQRIQARASTLQLSGVTEIDHWRGKHPWGNVPMQVIVLSWTPTSNERARATGAEISASHRIPGTPDTGNASPTVTGPGPSVAPVRRGAGSDTSRF